MFGNVIGYTLPNWLLGNLAQFGLTVGALPQFLHSTSVEYLKGLFPVRFVATRLRLTILVMLTLTTAGLTAYIISLKPPQRQSGLAGPRACVSGSDRILRIPGTLYPVDVVSGNRVRCPLIPRRGSVFE